MPSFPLVRVVLLSTSTGFELPFPTPARRIPLPPLPLPLSPDLLLTRIFGLAAVPPLTLIPSPVLPYTLLPSRVFPYPTTLIPTPLPWPKAPASVLFTVLLLPSSLIP